MTAGFSTGFVALEAFFMGTHIGKMVNSKTYVR